MVFLVSPSSSRFSHILPEVATEKPALVGGFCPFIADHLMNCFDIILCLLPPLDLQGTQHITQKKVKNTHLLRNVSRDKVVVICYSDSEDSLQIVI
jgi:hypothetical protein